MKIFIQCKLFCLLYYNYMLLRNVYREENQNKEPLHIISIIQIHSKSDSHFKKSKIKNLVYTYTHKPLQARLVLVLHPFQQLCIYIHNTVYNTNNTKVTYITTPTATGHFTSSTHSVFPFTAIANELNSPLLHSCFLYVSMRQSITKREYIQYVQTKPFPHQTIFK